MSRLFCVATVSPKVSLSYRNIQINSNVELARTSAISMLSFVNDNRFLTRFVFSVCRCHDRYLQRVRLDSFGLTSKSIYHHRQQLSMNKQTFLTEFIIGGRWESWFRPGFPLVHVFPVNLSTRWNNEFLFNYFLWLATTINIQVKLFFAFLQLKSREKNLFTRVKTDRFKWSVKTVELWFEVKENESKWKISTIIYGTWICSRTTVNFPKIQKSWSQNNTQLVFIYSHWWLSLFH